MLLSKVQIAQLRNLDTVTLDLSPSFNLFVGRNGAGKSSLLEAVAMLATGRSFRTSDMREVIRHGQSACHVYAEIDYNSAVRRYGLARMRSGGFEARVDGEAVRRLADALRLLPVQVISPESLALLSSGRKARCRFLDYGLFHVEQGFFELWRRYDRLLQQRNELLKRQAPDRELAPYALMLAEVAVPLTEMRASYLERLNQAVVVLAERVAPGVKLQLKFEQGWPSAQPFSDALAERLPRDRQQGFTSIGPQRAGFSLSYNGRAADEVCSRGQMKLAVTCLKLAQGEDMARALGQPILYLLDDIESELDRERRGALLLWLRQQRLQVLATAINEDAASALLETGDTLFHVEHGAVHPKN